MLMVRTHTEVEDMILKVRTPYEEHSREETEQVNVKLLLSHEFV